MAPHGTDRLAVHVDGNDYDGEMSTDAAGITACLFALSHLSFQVRNTQIDEHYHMLRDFAGRPSGGSRDLRCHRLKGHFVSARALARALGPPL